MKKNIQSAVTELNSLINRLQAIDDLIDSELGSDFLGDFLFDVAEEIYLISDEIKKLSNIPLTLISDERLN